MNLDGLINNLRVLWRADRIIADIQLRHMIVRSGINAVAALIAVFGLLFLEIAAYFTLIQIWTATASAGVLGASNLLLAGILVLIAARKKPDRELELAREVHKNAVEALQMNARSAQERFGQFARMEAMLAGLLIPLAGIVLKSLKKSKAAE